MQPTRLRNSLLPARFLIVAVSLTGLAGLTGCDGGGDFATLKENLLPPSPGEIARGAFSLDPDQRRRSIALLSSAIFGGEEPYVKLYRLMSNPYGADGEKDATVRAAAVSALGLHGTSDDVPLIAARLIDPNEEPFVKWEAAKALQKIHNPVAIVPLIRGLQDESEDVRMASAYALGQYPDRRVIDALLTVLEDQNFGVVENANESLQTLTGQGFEPDGVEWLRWIKENPDTMFKGQREYKWKPFNKPPSIWRKMKFWDPAKPKPDELPTGLKPVETQPAATMPAGQTGKSTQPADEEPATRPGGQPVLIGR